MTQISPRQQSILNRVVDAHIKTAQPVASRSITNLYQELYQGSYSPATVRNEMNQLEEMGYLTHPHTSAGRVPTDRGYRFYVDHDLPHEAIPGDWFRSLGPEDPGEDSMEPLAEKISSRLASAAEEVALVLIPERSAAPRRVSFRYRLFLQGSSRFLQKPEFQDLKKVRMLFQLLEEKMKLIEWFISSREHSELTVTIGRENGLEAFWDCSVVSAYYPCGHGQEGAVAVIGPRRTRYSRTVPLVRQMGEWLSHFLEKRRSGDGDE